MEKMVHDAYDYDDDVNYCHDDENDVLESNHVKFQCIHSHFEEISTLAPFTTHYAGLINVN